MEQRLGDVGGRRVRALPVGGAVRLPVLTGLAVSSAAPAVHWPSLLLALAGALVVERRPRSASVSAADLADAAATSGGDLRSGPAQRLWGWLQRQISDGVVHGHEEGERCNDLCRRTRAAA